MIDEESDRLNRFIEGLSTPDRSEPPQPLHLRAVDCHDVIQAGSEARRDADARSPRQRDDSTHRLPRLSVDAASMIEVIYILLDNASKYAPAGIDDHGARGAGGRAPRASCA